MPEGIGYGKKAMKLGMKKSKRPGSVTQSHAAMLNRAFDVASAKASKRKKK